MRETPENITSLRYDEIFVFGANTAGKHGAGAARFAMNNFGAKYGVGHGFTGQCYALPTKNEKIKTMCLSVINLYVFNMICKAKDYPDKKFLVTKIGCGLAGLTPREVAPMFVEAIDCKNIYLPREFWYEIFRVIGGETN